MATAIDQRDPREAMYGMADKLAPSIKFLGLPVDELIQKWSDVSSTEQVKTPLKAKWMNLMRRQEVASKFMRQLADCLAYK